MGEFDTAVGFAASVVVPAHDEEHALPRLLASLLGQDAPDLALQVVVVVNGSSDRSAHVARAEVGRFAERGNRLTVVETPIASKAAALNAGDRYATAFPRLYIDADVVLSRSAVRRTIQELDRFDTPRLAAPSIAVAENPRRLVRHYAKLWAALPYIRAQVPGVGFYGVNEAGRQRWWRFPTRLRADDKFVRLHFGADEIAVIDDTNFTVFLPERIGEMIRVRARWTSSNREIVRLCPRLARSDRSRWRSSARHLTRAPQLWRWVPGFLLVWHIAWALSLPRRLGLGRGWSRSDSSAVRMPAPATDRGRLDPLLRPTAGQLTLDHRRCDRTVHTVVVTHNSGHLAPRCLASLLASEGLDDLRITVVDNCSVDGGPELVARLFPGIEVVENDTNVGYAGAVNQALKSSTSSWFVIINPDAEVHPGTIESCIDHLERHSATGCCGVRAVDADGAVNDRSFFMRPTLWSELMLCVGAHRLMASSRRLNAEQYLAHRPVDAAADVDAVAGCFTVIERSLFEHLGGYDESYFLCGEDRDLGARATEAGACPVVVPSEPILHRSAHSFATSVDARVAYMRGRTQYQRRHWPRSRATTGRLLRRLSVLGRLVVATITRSARASEFSELWARRSEWSPQTPSSLGVDTCVLQGRSAET